MNLEFIEKLIAAREAKGWNKRTLAIAAGKTPTTIGDLEKGKRNPSRRMVMDIAAALGCAPEPLLSAAGFKPSQDADLDVEEESVFQVLSSYRGDDLRVLTLKQTADLFQSTKQSPFDRSGISLQQMLEEKPRQYIVKGFENLPDDILAECIDRATIEAEKAYVKAYDDTFRLMAETLCRKDLGNQVSPGLGTERGDFESRTFSPTQRAIPDPPQKTSLVDDLLQ